MDATATINLKVPTCATANREQLQLAFEVDVQSDGEHLVNVWARESDAKKTTPHKLVFRFDSHEWERFKRAMVEVDEVVKAVENGGAYFRIGQPPATP